MPNSYTWAEIKAVFNGMSPSTFSGKFVNQDSGSPTELSLYARLTNNEIAANPYKFHCMMREYTLTLTGATEYDLATLVPDCSMIYQVVGDNNQKPYMPLQEFNVTSGGIGFTVFAKTKLRFKNPPSSGTLTIPYYSRYAVVSNTGTRKMDFTVDTDETVFPYEMAPVLIEGIMRFVYRKEGKKYTRPQLLWNGSTVDLDPFIHLLEQAIQEDKAVARSIYDFRFNI